MPDYPYVYGAQGPRPVMPGGTRIRLPRRRTPSEGGEDRAGGQAGEGGGQDATPWKDLIREAVADLNASFQSSGAPFVCEIEEDAQGYSLVVRRFGSGEPGEAIEEEALEPSELPEWLDRIRARLGILLDEKA